jgi:hypothetical protein
MLLQPTRQASIRGNPSVALRRDQAKLTATPALLLSYFSAGQKAVANEAAAIASIPDDVFFTTKLVCRLAGKPFAVDEFKFEQLIKISGLTSETASASLRRSAITTFKNAPHDHGQPDTSFFFEAHRPRSSP